MGKWSYYNFAAGSFHTKQLCSRLYSTEIELYFKKTKKTLFEPPFGGFRGNIYTPSIVHWKVHGWLPIRHNWTFFATPYSWNVISGNLSKSAFLKGVGHFECKFQMEGVSPTNHRWCQQTRVMALCVVSKYLQCIIWFCHKVCVWQMDGQTELWLPRPRYHSCIME